MLPGSGTFFCLDCGSQLSLRENDALPECPRCRGSAFRRDSMFEPMQEHGQQTAEMSILPELAQPDWLEEARIRLPRPGNYLARRAEEGEILVFPIDRGWTRIGRSIAADVRLDDRSLNGIFLNGELVEWAKLEDGDELTIGRYRLFALEA
jgi:Zinc-ribbon containing domain